MLVVCNVVESDAPHQWIRFDWTWDAKSGLWYCQSAHAENSEEHALAADVSSPSDPSNGGCGSHSFAWTQVYGVTP